MTDLADPVAVLLAGGQSRRMLGQDKALALIAGQRMIDRVLHRVRPQASQLLLAAPHDYGTGVPAIADLPDGPAGPVGAIRALALHLADQGSDAFVTVPVDAPFVPPNLVARLAACGPVAMARQAGAWQPAFALWSARAVLSQLPPERCAQKWSLQRLAEALDARAVDFADADSLMNVNTPEDLALARRRADAALTRSGAD